MAATPDARAGSAALRDPAVWAVVGQILERGQTPRHVEQSADDLELRFDADEARFVTNVMAGNLSVKRERFLELAVLECNLRLSHVIALIFDQALLAAGLLAGLQSPLKFLAELKVVEAAHNYSRGWGSVPPAAGLLIATHNALWQRNLCLAGCGCGHARL